MLNEFNKKNINKEKPLKSKEEMELFIKQIANQEQLYSIALFDILGFSNFVKNNGHQVILDLYNKLLDLIYKQQSSFDGAKDFAGFAAPVPITNDWKQGMLIGNAGGYVNVCHFSDTFIIYVNFNLRRQGFWFPDSQYEPYPLLLGEIGTPYYPIFYERHHIYLSFLQTCMEFFCQSIVAGIPLRGCVSTGLATMNSDKTIYFGEPLVEAARGESSQNSLGIAFGKSFNNCHPVYNNYFIPYLAHIKKSDSNFLSPMVLDWARYWRESADYEDYNITDCINKMNTDSAFSSYYDNAIQFFEFSAAHKNWYHEINRDGIKDITDYYNKTKEWYNSIT